MSSDENARDPLEHLLQQRADVRRLALRLLGDPHVADDVAQDAMVVALTRRPAALQDAVAWLSRVVQNLVAQRRRGDGRRRSHEQAAARQRAADEQQLVDAAGAHRELVEHVLALPAPLRAVLLQRYFEGLPPREIARRQGVATSTISNRLSKAHRALRERLERQRGREWALALAPIANLPLATPALWFGGKWLAGVAAAALVALTWLAVAPKNADASPPVGDGGGAPVAQGAPADERPDDASRQRLSLADQPRALPASVIGEVVDATRAPIEGVVVRAAAPGGGPRWQASSDARGRYELRDLPANELLQLQYLVGEAVYLEQAITLQPEEARSLRCTLTLSARLHGVVVDEHGAPVTDIEVMLAASRGDGAEYARNVQRERVRARATTDAAGAFVFEHVAPGRYLLGPTGRNAPKFTADGVQILDIDERVAGLLQAIDVPVNQPDVHERIVAHTQQFLAGEVVFPDGRPAPGVLLLATQRGVGGSLRADTDTNGRFRFGPLVAGTYRVTDNSGPKGFGLYEWLSFEAGRTDLRLVLREGGGVAGRAVVVAQDRGMAGWIIVRPSPNGMQRANAVAAQTSERRGGRFGFESLAPGDYDLSFVSDDCEWFGFLTAVQVSPRVTFADAVVPLQPAAQLELRAGTIPRTRVRIELGGRTFHSLVLKAGDRKLVPVPPGELLLRYRDADGVEVEQAAHAQVGSATDVELQPR